MIKFNQFEKIKRALDEGKNIDECAPLMESANISEGVFGDIMNYFSKLLGGKVSKLDKIVNKYKDNEHEYWAKWADANFKYNEADTLMKQTTDAAEKAKYFEMKERADKLLKVVDSSRDDVNDALKRQAQGIVKNNARLGDYYIMIKAKADEDVANESYAKLKKLSDKDTVDTLYKKVEVDTENARKKEIEFKKKYGGQASGSIIDQPKAKLDDSKEVPFKTFNITDLAEFALSADKGFYSTLDSMPKANLKALVDYMKKMMQAIEANVGGEIKKYQDSLKSLNPSSTDIDTKRDALAKDIKVARASADEDLGILKERINKIENKMLVG